MFNYISYITGRLNDTSANDTATNDTSNSTSNICPPEGEKSWPPSNDDCDGWVWSYLRCRDGRKGRKGEKGKKGDSDGPKGPQGPKGYKGCNGTEEGDMGYKGNNGSKGDNGPNGQKGEPGVDGIPGIDGGSGPAGMDGGMGEDGQNGTKGEKGVPGDTGPPGSFQGVGTDDLFIHWGNSSCTDPESTIYTGRVATPERNQIGGGADILCLPDDPTFLSSLTPSVSSLIHGVEYSDGFGPLSPLDNENVPCSVCLATGYVVTIPGAIECPENGTFFSWKLEYQGYIMTTPTFSSATSNINPSRFICVEKDAEAIPGLNLGISVGQIAHVHVQCFFAGGLDCPAYMGREIDCAVCSIQP